MSAFVTKSFVKQQSTLSQTSSHLDTRSRGSVFKISHMATGRSQKIHFQTHSHGLLHKGGLTAGKLASSRASTHQRVRSDTQDGSHSLHTAALGRYIEQFCTFCLLEIIDSAHSMGGDYVRCEFLEEDPLGAIFQAD